MVTTDDWQFAGPPIQSNSSSQDSFNHVVPDHTSGMCEELPPEFVPYQAEFSITDNWCVVSHDAHLNEDGEALYRFLLSHASKPPLFFLHCKGTHDEKRTRVVSYRTADGREKKRKETHTETVTDFDFMVNIGQSILASPSVIHWSIPDEQPAYRGLIVREVDLGSDDGLKYRRKAKSSEIELFETWEHERQKKGLPPWAERELLWHENSSPVALHENTELRSSKTLRNWADEYCASQKYLKEFTYEKVVYGWNFDALKSAIRATIVSTSYTGEIDVSFEYAANKVCVRSDNFLSRILSNPWLESFVNLVYPFIWLFKRFCPWGGGRWEICGGAYALQRSVPANEQNSEPKMALQDQQTNISSSSGPIASRVGLREGQWLRQWERSIKHAVASRMRDCRPMTQPQLYELPNNVALSLDGYTE